MNNLPFNSSEITTLLEVARLAMADDAILEDIGQKMDLSYDDMLDLQDKLHAYMNDDKPGKKITSGSLELVGLRNELYGHDPEANCFTWIATMGDVDIDEETGETVDYDPNADALDLADAYGFTLVNKPETVASTCRRCGAGIPPARVVRLCDDCIALSVGESTKNRAS